MHSYVMLICISVFFYIKREELQTISRGGVCLIIRLYPWEANACRVYFEETLPSITIMRLDAILLST